MKWGYGQHYPRFFGAVDQGFKHHDAQFELWAPVVQGTKEWEKRAELAIGKMDSRLGRLEITFSKFQEEMRQWKGEGNPVSTMIFQGMEQKLREESSLSKMNVLQGRVLEMEGQMTALSQRVVEFSNDFKFQNNRNKKIFNN